MVKIYYVIHAYRYGELNAHNYLVDVKEDLNEATKIAEEHREYRGGKYGVSVFEVKDGFVTLVAHSSSCTGETKPEESIL